MSKNASTNASNETRRKQILDAAIIVLLEKGFSSSSMNDFIRASGLSKGGVYHHFKSKEDLLMGVVNRYFEEYLAEVTAIDLSNETAYGQLQHFLTGHQDLLLKMGKLSQLLMDFYVQAAHIPSLRDQFRTQYVTFQRYIADIVKRGIENGEFVNTTTPNAIASGLIGVFDGICAGVLIAPDDIDFPNFAVEAAMAMVDGICV